MAMTAPCGTSVTVVDVPFASARWPNQSPTT